MTTSVDQARELLGGERVNGHDLVAGHADRHGLTLLTSPRRAWSWPRRPKASCEPKAPARRDGSRLIAFSAALLTLLAVGLLSVSIAAQYRYFLAERHQITASMIESGALDVGMLVFSLLALGLARKGLPARPERALILACATTSAVMNYAPARAGDWRSVLAWTMPPVFLAVVADRVIAVTRRHFLGMAEGRSAWRDGLGWMATAAKVAGLTVLYVLRVPLAPVSTGKGLRLAVLNATPLPQAPERPAGAAARKDTDEPAAISGKSASCECPAPYYPGGPVPCEALGQCMRPPEPPAATCAQCGQTPLWGTVHVCPGPDEGPERRSGGLGTKTERLLALVVLRHGDLADIPLNQVSKIATACAPEIDMHPASARGALLSAVRAALPAGGSDSK